MLTRLLFSVLTVSAGLALAQDDCRDVPANSQLKKLLVAAANVTDPPLGGPVGGLFNGTRMWAAVVDRSGEVCAFTTSTDDPTQVWPGSQAIAKAKAYTANAFNLDVAPFLSTARLYTFTQPGHSLWSLGQANPFDPNALAGPNGNSSHKGDIAGGMIFFGGGLPLYRNGRIIGGLGISGDTSCADHEIAKRVRHLAALDPPGGPLVDDIVYTQPDGPSPFAHPVCPNTRRNGKAIGDEQPASGY